jgi:outer membrane protein OmpA-like peptidoglycan-associated protein
MRRMVTLAVILAATALVSGCATKGWVQELMTKKQAQIDERFVGVEGRVSAETQRLDGRLGTVETSATAASEAARDAHSRAEAAYGRADEVNSRLTRLWSTRNKRNLVETVHVQFAFDRADLSDGAQTALLSIIKELKENPQLSVDLEGFADATGTHTYNVALSQRRVEAVRRFLIKNGTEMSRIYWAGLGPLEPTARADEKAKQRRVSVKLMVNPD